MIPQGPAECNAEGTNRAQVQWSFCAERWYDPGMRTLGRLLLIGLLAGACSESAPGEAGGAPPDTVATDGASRLGDAAIAPDAAEPPCTVHINEVGRDAGGRGFVELRFEGAIGDGRLANACGAVTLALIGASQSCDADPPPGIALASTPIPNEGLWLVGVPGMAAHQTVADLELAPAGGVVALLSADGSVLEWVALPPCDAIPPCAATLGLAAGPCAPLPEGALGKSISVCPGGLTLAPPQTPGRPNACACPGGCPGSGNPCQESLCGEVGCELRPRPDGTKCEDADPCTAGDQCVGGTCVGEAKACEPATPCQGAGSCDAQTGQCVYESACHPLATCAPGDPPVCQCLPGTTGDGYTCQQTCACPLEAGCPAATAVLRIVPLDIWSQPLPSPDVTLSANGTPLPLTQQGSSPVRTRPICGSADLRLDVHALQHHELAARIQYDGSGGAAGISLTDLSPIEQGALYLTTAVQGEGADALRVYTLWTGSPHRYFSSEGRPARYGNHLTLHHAGEPAWLDVRSVVLAAQEIVTSATWWWTSQIEWLRDPATHANLTQSERWLETALGILESLVGVDVKVLVNQFFSQDGLLAGFTVDDALLAKAENPSDHIDFLGQANPTKGQVTIAMQPIPFGVRVDWAWPSALDEAIALDSNLPPFLPPYVADLSALPLGLSLVDVAHASWHQKFLTVDGTHAFIGGMNVKTTDWDTVEHSVFEFRRMEFAAKKADRVAVMNKEQEPDFGPRKDYMLHIEGPSAADAVDVFHRRWHYQLSEGVEYSDKASPFPLSAPPPPVEPGHQAQVIATMPAPFNEHAILESLLRAISQAEHFILIEDQYFRAPMLYEAIAARMQAVPGLVLVVVTNYIDPWVDPSCWQTSLSYDLFRINFPTRFRLYRLRAFDWADTGCTLCIDETAGYFHDMDLHSKIVVIDDIYMEVGSCNSNNRGLLYEGELATAVVDPVWVAAERHKIIRGFLGPTGPAEVPPSQLIQTLDASAAYNDAIYDSWDAAGFDRNRNGQPVPLALIPKGLLYTLEFVQPNDCLWENVGPDVM